MSLNVTRYKRPVMPLETKSFTDPLQPGVAIELTLQAFDGLRQELMRERAADLTAEFITGRDGADPKPFPAIEDASGRMTIPELSTSLMNAIALCQTMEVGDEPSSIYEWVHLAACFPSVWTEIQIWAGDLLARANQTLGNVLGASGT
jgi:hypothetical protein